MSQKVEVFTIVDWEDPDTDVVTQYELRATAYCATKPTARSLYLPSGEPGDPDDMDEIEYSVDGGKTWQFLEESHPGYSFFQEQLWEEFDRMEK